MRKLLMIFCLLAVFTACSDGGEDGASAGNPFLPVTGIDIPKRAMTGTQISIQGQGFTEGCEIWLEPNGGQKMKTEIVRVDGNGVVFSVSPLFSAGFYVVILKQDGKEYRIGGINLEADDLAPESIEAYGVKGELDPKVYPVSISQKIVGQQIFSLRSGYYLNAILLAPDKKAYYSGFTIDVIGGKPTYVYYVGYYDFTTRKQADIPWGKVSEFVAIGLIDDNLHALRSADNKEYVLVRLDGEGNETPVATYDFTPAGAEKIWDNNGRFYYDKSRNFLYMTGYTGRGSDLTSSTFAINMTTSEVRVSGSNTQMRYGMAMAGDMVYYFGREGDNDIYTSRAILPTNPSSWTLNDPGVVVATLAGVNLTKPVYAKAQKMIYAIGEDETVLTFDPATNTLSGKKWVKSGLVSLFVLEN